AFSGCVVNPAGDLFTPVPRIATYLIRKENIQPVHRHYKRDAQLSRQQGSGMPTRKCGMRMYEVERFLLMESARLTQKSRKKEISRARQTEPSGEGKKTTPVRERHRFIRSYFFTVKGLCANYSTSHTNIFQCLQRS